MPYSGKKSIYGAGNRIPVGGQAAVEMEGGQKGNLAKKKSQSHISGVVENPDTEVPGAKTLTSSQLLIIPWHQKRCFGCGTNDSSKIRLTKLLTVLLLTSNFIFLSS